MPAGCGTLGGSGSSPASTMVPTILLVEDDDAHRALIRSALEGDGYQVQESRNGKEALRHIVSLPLTSSSRIS